VRKQIHTSEQKQLCALLREIREEASLTQIGLAKILKTDQTIISKYETGERRLDILELREVCEAVGVTLADFVRRLEKALRSK
jgi:transcriptional regulator with XRE-family HTH domain